MSDSSTIILLRHGEPATKHPLSGCDTLSGCSTSEKIFRGITDDPLTQKGWRQMSAALDSLSDIDQIFTSPLKRCADFARQFSNEHSLPIEIIDDLKEINFGQWEGQSVQTISDNYSEQLKMFWEKPLEYTPPDGEPVLDFQKRVISAWKKLLISQKGKTCLIVTHGGVQKMVLAEVLKMPIEAIHNIEVPYACCSTFQIYYSGSEIIATLKSHRPLNQK